MILKIQKKNLEWEIIDGFDRVSSSLRKRDENIGVRKDHYDFRKYNPPQKTEDGSSNPSWDYFIELWLYKGHEPIKQILANSPIYILNDEGRTVERI